MFDTQSQNRGTSTSASMKKASSTANIADDLSAIFGGGTNYSRSSDTENLAIFVFPDRTVIVHLFYLLL